MFAIVLFYLLLIMIIKFYINHKEFNFWKKPKKVIILPAVGKLIAINISTDIIRSYISQKNSLFYQFVITDTERCLKKVILNELLYLEYANLLKHRICLTRFKNSIQQARDKIILMKDFSDNLSAHISIKKVVLIDSNPLFKQAIKTNDILSKYAKILYKSIQKQWQITSKNIISKTLIFKRKQNTVVSKKWVLTLIATINIYINNKKPTFYQLDNFIKHILIC